MRLLVVGGTRFVGRHIVQAALERGHDVTLFNRGRSGTAPAGVQLLLGDRREDLRALAGQSWDAAIDTCGYLPAEVASMADTLAARVGHYLFISSVSVYAGFAQPNREDSAVGTLADPDTTTVDGDSYGPLKARCEAALMHRRGDRAVVLRPGLVVGPFDPTQRFTWWPARLARAIDGQPVLAPGRPQTPVQWIDARDLAAFACLAVERGLQGIYNVVSPADAFRFGDLLQACADAAGTRPTFAWRAVDALVAQGLAPWTDLPLVLPDDDEHRAFMRTDGSRALAAGLRIRPLAATVTDTLAWWRGLPAELQVFDKAGLTPERERQAIVG